MTRVLRRSSLVVLLVVAAMFLVSCGVSQKWADKISDAAEADEHYTYDDLMKKFGDPVVDATIEAGSVGRSGATTWVKGYDNLEDYQQAVEDNKFIKALIVEFLNGKAVSAQYSEGYPEDEK